MKTNSTTRAATEEVYLVSGFSAQTPPATSSPWFVGLLSLTGLCLAASSVEAQVSSPALLEVTAAAVWEPLYANDPLRIEVRIGSPYAEQRVHLGQLQREGGATNLPSPVIPTVAANWVSGLSMTLWHLETNGTRSASLTPQQWPSFLRPPVVSLPDLPYPSLARQAEWLVPATAAALQPGDYLLDVIWAGSGLTDASFLPSNGLLAAQSVAFAVKEPASNAEQAAHWRRVAYDEFMRRDNVAAREHAGLSLQLDPQSQDPERSDAQFLLAHAAYRMRDYLATADVYKTMANAPWSPGEHSWADVAQTRLSWLAPTVRATPVSEGMGGTVVQVLALPNQTYITSVSSDLQDWTALATNRPTVNGYELTDPVPPNGRGRFYRVSWLAP